MTVEDKQQPRVVIIGGGLTGMSVAAGCDMHEIPFLLLEREERLGGQIHTRQQAGYTFETGPNTGSVSTPEVAELFEYVAPEAEMEVAKSASEARWIWKGDRFHPLPSGPISGLTTPLFSWRDKLHIPFEPLVKQGTDPNESVGDLAERRLGKSMVDYAVDPFIGGVYAGDPYKLVTRLALPKLYDLERKYGSFIGGSMKLMRERKPTERDKKATKKVFNVVGGLSRLIEGIERKASRSGRFVTGATDIRIRPVEDHRYEVTFTSGGESETVRCDHVVTTIRPDLLPPLFPDDWAGRFDRIRTLVYAPITEVVVGFDHLPGVERRAFGALVPTCERRRVLGILFPSSCFDGRVPYEDSALFTIFMGGLRNPELVTGTSLEERQEIALSELYEMMRIPQEIRPDLVFVAPYSHAIPEYDLTTEGIHEDIRRLETEYPGLQIAGGVRDGIGMAKRITQGISIADAIAGYRRE